MVDDAKTWTTRIPSEVYQDPQFSRKYAIERELGMGGAGVVVCARHRELDERVAIKFLLPGIENSSAIARFRREARAANRVKDEHVVRIIDVSTTETGVPYVVMEYLEGVDLERMLLESPNRQLPVRDAIEFVLQACEALAECHRIGIVHRDLKPSNLFCSYGADGLPLIKILDFGISKLSATLGEGAMTGKHGIIGSPRYMSPEQFASPADVDLRTDIWALGVILYELVSGAAPFTGNTVIKLWEHVKTGVPATVVSLRRDAPLALDAIVRRCLEKDPDKRYQNVAELAKALLPLGPERSRNSVARIVRVVESPGSTTASLSLPRTLAEHDITPGPVSKVERSKPKALLALGLLAAVALALAVLVPRHREDAAARPNDTAKGAVAQVTAVVPKAPPVAASAPPEFGPSAPNTAATAANAPLASAASAVISAEPPRSALTPRVARSEAGRAVTSRVPDALRPRPNDRVAAAASATPVALVDTTPPTPVPVPSAPLVEAPKPPSAVAPAVAPSAKWLVDIVEQRKPRRSQP